MVMLAIHHLLLSKYTGQEDIVVGTGIAGRRHADLEHIMGMFVNMLAIRNRPQGHKSFLEFLAEVKNNALNAFNNQDYQFEELVRKLGWQGDSARNPLFDTVFQVQALEFPELTVPGLTIKPFAFKNPVTRFDLIIFAEDNGDTIEMKVSYSTELFNSSTAEEIVKNYLEILDQAINTPDMPLKDFTITTELVEAQIDIFKEDQSDFGFE
jgi:non-ribosomal peptide synthetase component F